MGTDLIGVDRCDRARGPVEHARDEIDDRTDADPSTIGNLHDAMYPLHRFVHWMVHEDGDAT